VNASQSQLSASPVGLARRLLLIAALMFLLQAGTTVARADQPVFPVMNTSETPPDGVWFRYGPDPNQTTRTTGVGVYYGEHVRVKCYWHGTPLGPYNNDVWYYAYDVERPTAAGQSNEGWINTHYVDDGMTANQPNPAVPQCASGSGDGGTVGTGGGSSGPLGEGASVFFQPRGHHDRTRADADVEFGSWAPGGCRYGAGAVSDPLGGSWLGTLAGWSLARLGPVYFLAAASSEVRSHVHYVLIIDPGNGSQFASSCDASVAPSRVLADWLSLSSGNHLVVITAQKTASDDHRGLQHYYLTAIKARHLNAQVLVCNDDHLTHSDAFKKYAQGSGGAYIRGQKFRCPYGVLGWHP
jgi:hypothetical protein